jgi:hypothetical protein
MREPDVDLGLESQEQDLRRDDIHDPAPLTLKAA